ELTPATAPAVIDLCRLVGGMPLGLELAASWIRTLSCAEIAAEIAQSLDFLSASRYDVPARHQSLSVVFAQSWQLLSELERQVFRRLSIFQGGLSREAAEQVAGASLPLLSALVDKSLLRRNSSGHYEIHELVRQYAAEKLAGLPSECLETQARHGHYYARFLHRRDPHLKGQKQPVALAEIKDQIENIRSAWQWAIRQGQLDAIERSQECLYFYYEICGRFQEGEELFQQAIAGLTECHPAVEKMTNGNQAAPEIAVTYPKNGSATTRQRDKLLAELLARRGGLLDRLGLYEQAQELLQQSLAMFEHLGAHQETAFPLYHLGYIAFVLGDYEAAKNFAQESLALFRANDDRWGIAPVLNTLGDILIALGIVEEAQYVFQESLEIATDLELRAGVGWSHQGLGDTNRLLKDYAVSQAHYEQGLAIFTEVDAREGMAWALHGLGDVARERQDYRQAAQYQQQSLDLFEEIGDLNAMSETLNALGNTAYALADYDQARVYFQRALQVAVEVRAIPVALDVLVGLARVLAEAGACEQALELLAVALDHPGSEKETLDKAASFLSKLPAPLAPAGMRATQAHHAAPTLEEVALKLCENLTGF
ncbi:MAG TPA: tetratricopeptide repeat protein, partial [Anaerolineae bacterium]